MNFDSEKISQLDDATLLQNIYTAVPCNADWDSMTGDERKRFCGSCKLNVYNVASMSTKEAAQLIRASEGERVCMRLYRRKDGTIITDNCPVGLRKMRDRVRLKVAAVLALFAWLGFAGEAPAQSLGAIAPMSQIQREANVSSQINFFTACASAASSIGILIFAVKKKARPTVIGLMLLAIWMVAGFVFGFTSLSQPQACIGF